MVQGGGGCGSGKEAARFTRDKRQAEGVCRGEKGHGYRVWGGKLMTPAPPEPPLSLSPGVTSATTQPWLALGTLSAHASCSPSLPQGHLPQAPKVPLCAAHLGPDVLIGGRANKGEADEEDVLGTEQATVTQRGGLEASQPGSSTPGHPLSCLSNPSEKPVPSGESSGDPLQAVWLWPHSTDGESEIKGLPPEPVLLTRRSLPVS